MRALLAEPTDLNEKDDDSRTSLMSAGDKGYLDTWVDLVSRRMETRETTGQITEDFSPAHVLAPMLQ